MSETISCRGRRLFFESRMEELPNGNRVRVDRVRFPNSVAILPVDEGNCRVLIIRQYRPSINNWILEAPAGVIDPGETPIEAANRELEEETGFTASRLVRVGEAYVSPGYSTELITLFLAFGLSEGKARPESHEVIKEKVWINLEDIDELIERGEIRDLKTIALVEAAARRCRVPGRTTGG